MDGLPTAPAPPPVARVPWTGLSILLVWVGGELCLMGILAALQGVALMVYGPEWRDVLGRNASTWLTLSALLFALPLRLAAGILSVRAFSQARLSDMGLTADRLLRNILLGLALALPLALAVYAVQMGCEWILKGMGADVVQEHPFSQLARGGLTPVQWAVLIAAAVIAAPVWEEFLFRGLVQPWAVDRDEGSAVLMGLAACLALVFRIDRIQAAWRAGAGQPFFELLPFLVAVALIPVYLALRGVTRSLVPAALFASAVLFGWLHVSVWPSPVSLTVLAIGLGWLRHQTGSLAGPIALHAAFNAVAVVMLLLEPWWRPG